MLFEGKITSLFSQKCHSTNFNFFVGYFLNESFFVAPGF